MADDGTLATDDGSGLAGGVGGLSNYGMLPLAGFTNFGQNMGGQVMDPGFYQAMNRQRFAQALMKQGMDASPVRSPWAAVARGVQGLLGGYEMVQSERLMGTAQQQMQAQAAQGWQQAQDIINGAMQSGAGGPGGPGGGPGPAGAGGGQGAPGAYEGVILRHEGYGAPGNKGGPEGWGGFIPTTWQTFVQAHPALFQGKTPDQALAMRHDPALVSQAVTWLAQQNAPVLQRNNVPVNGQTLGLAHYLGGQGAAWMWNAPDNVSARSVLEANLGKDRAATWIVANPELGTKTAGEIKAKYTGTPNPVFLGATGAEGGGGPGGQGQGGGPVPGSGYAAAIRLSMLGAQMAQNVTNPYAAAMGKNLMALAPRLAQIGQYGPPVQGAAPGLYNQQQFPSGKVETGGMQLSAESFMANDFATMQQLSAKANGNWAALSPQEQQAYTTAWTRQTRMTADPADNTLKAFNPGQLVPSLMHPPGTVGGGAPAPAPTPGPPGTPTPETPAPTPTPGPPVVGAPGLTIKQGQQQYDADLATANDLRKTALEQQPMRMLTDQIRALAARTPTNVMAPIQLEASRLMAGLGYDPATIVKATRGMDPADGEMLQKLFTQFSTQATRQMGAHEAGSVVSLFMKNYPSIESRPLTINEFTRATDMQNLFNQRRSELAQQWLDFYRGRPADYRSLNSPEFDKFARAQGLDPSLYTAAALMASGRDPSVYTSGLPGGEGRGPAIDAAARLAWQTWPGVGIVGPNGKIHHGEGQ